MRSCIACSEGSNFRPVSSSSAPAAPSSRAPRSAAPLRAAAAASPSSEQGGRREKFDAGGRELDRKREVVETAADLEHSLPVAVEREAREDGARPLCKQLQRLDFLQRRDLILVLGGEMERRSARREHLQARRRREQLGRDGSGGLEVLEVVEQQEKLLLAQVSLERCDDRLTALITGASVTR